MLNYNDPLFVVLALTATGVALLGLFVHYATHRDRVDGASVAETPWRRVLGLTSMVPLPAAGFAFPFTALVAVVALVLPSRTRWTRVMALLTLAGVAGLSAIIASAVLQQVLLPLITIYALAGFVLFFLTGCKVTTGVADAAQLLAWVSIGTSLFFLFFDATRSDTLTHLWKYGIGPSVTVFTVYIVCSRTNLLGATATLVLFGGLSVGLGFRSFGLICLAAAVISAVSKRGGANRGFRVLRLTVTVGGLALLSWALPTLINAGVFGREVRDRTLSEDIAGVSPLLAGRVEPPLSLAAIITKPFFGWGNADSIDQHTLTVGSTIANALGMTSPSLYINLWRRSDGHISLHSILFESWAQGGFLAAILPLSLIVLFSTALVRGQGRYAPLIVLVSALSLWDLAFSPWNHNRPLIFAVSAVLACHAIKHSVSGELAPSNRSCDAKDLSYVPSLRSSTILRSRV